MAGKVECAAGDGLIGTMNETNRADNAKEQISPKNRFKRMLGFFKFSLFIAIIGGLLFWVINQGSFRLIDTRVFMAALGALLVSAITILLMAWRLVVLARGAVGFAGGVKATSLVASLLIALPSRLSDIVKPVYLRQQEALPMARGFSILLFERALDVIVVATMLLLAAYLVSAPLMQQFEDTLYLFVIFSIIVVSGVLMLVLYQHRLENILENLPIAFARNTALQLLHAVGDLSDKKLLGKALILSLIVWLSSYLIFYTYITMLGFVANGNILDQSEILLVFLAGTIGLVVTVTPGGVGTFELAIALALGIYGISLADGLLHGLILRIIVLLPNLAVTLFMLLFDDFSFKGLRDNLQYILKRNLQR